MSNENSQIDWCPGIGEVVVYETAISTGPQYLNPDPEPVPSRHEMSLALGALSVRGRQDAKKRERVSDPEAVEFPWMAIGSWA